MASQQETIVRVIQKCNTCLKTGTHIVTSREIVCFHCGATTRVPKRPIPTLVGERG